MVVVEMNCVCGADRPVRTTLLIDESRWRGDDGSPLRMSELPGLPPEEIDRDERSIWRYRGVLPVDPGCRVSLGEGCSR